MTTFIIIAVLVALFFLFVITKGKKEEETKENSVSMPYVDVSVSTEPDENETYNEPIKQVSDGWVINPGCPFELTVTDCDFKTAQRVRDLCNQGDYQSDKELLSLFAAKNIKIKEIEAYKKKYAPIYFQRIEDMKSSSEEYKNAGLKDKESMLEEFKVAAMGFIYELPEFDVYELFIEDDTDKFYELIKHYGFECLETYSYHKVGSIVVVNGKPSRAIYDKMVEKGMAIRGENIPLIEVLNSQSLKVLNTIANNPQKEYKRKSQAIEYILGDEETVASIEEHIAFRELYKILPLTDEFGGFDKESFQAVINCFKLQVLLLLRTYNDSVNQWEKDHRWGEDRKSMYKICKISNPNSRCKCAQDRMKQTYSVDAPPKTPCHIGCSCWLNYE